MSYILDALRKSERERQQAEPLVLNPIGPDAIELPRRRLGPAAGVAALLIGAAALSAYWMHATSRPGLTPPVTVPSAVSSGSPAKNATPATPATTGERRVSTKVRPAPELRPSPFVSARQPSATRDLAKEVRVEPSQPEVQTPQAPVPPVSSTATVATDGAAAPAINGSVKFLRAMPPEFQRELPELIVSIHIYAPREADRILYINDRQYHAGDRVREGIVIEEIVQDGVVLNYRGQRFKLPRPA